MKIFSTTTASHDQKLYGIARATNRVLKLQIIANGAKIITRISTRNNPASRARLVPSLNLIR
jgi:hypothetical protein